MRALSRVNYWIVRARLIPGRYSFGREPAGLPGSDGATVPAAPRHPIVLTDPRGHPRQRWLGSLAAPLLNDQRDAPFVNLSLAISATVVPFAMYLCLPGAFSWWLAAAYLALILGIYLGPFVLMLPNTSHRPLFRTRYRALNLYVPWVLGPFFGLAPDGYYVHHVGMHHPENNLSDDLSSTMRYQRDSVADFARYLGWFLLAGVPALVRYMGQRHRARLVRRLVLGEVGVACGLALLLLLNWRAALVIFVIPFIVV